MDHERPFRVVCGVIQEALRSSGREGVVLAGGGPESQLLEAWLSRAAIPFVLPPPGLLERANALWAEGLGGPPPLPGTEGRSDPAWEWEGEKGWVVSGLAGRALAAVTRRLLMGTESKSLLLLGHHPTQAPFLPLGDLYASEIEELAGDCTLPVAVRLPGPVPPTAVDRALRAHFEYDTPWEDATSHLPAPVEKAVTRGLARARFSWRPTPLIPKLGGATLGIDLDL